MFAFGGCSALEAVTFSADAKVLSLGEAAFYGTYNVTEFTLEPGSKYLSVNNGFLYSKDMSKLILAPAGKIANRIVLPATVKEIGDYAFSYKAGVGTFVMTGVEVIGKGAFTRSTVRSVTLSDSLKEIGDDAFNTCPYLTSFALPGSLEEIGDSAFYGCTNIAWGDFTLPASVTEIGENAFLGNYGITTVTLPAQLTEIPYGMFTLCKNLTSVSFGGKVDTIGGYAFRQCENLEEITLPVGHDARRGVLCRDGTEEDNSSRFRRSDPRLLLLRRCIADRCQCLVGEERRKVCLLRHFGAEIA